VRKRQQYHGHIPHARIMPMVITYVGGNCFKVSAGDTTIAVNPPSASSKHKVPKFGADIVIIPAAHPDWDGEETASHGAKEPFVVRGPGAYEVGDVVITGYASEGAQGKETNDYGNAVYAVQFDGMNILLLGALSSAKLPQEIRADLDDVDIVFVPLGDSTLEAKSAHDLIVSLEAKLIIPYAVGTDKDLKEFVNLSGAAGAKPQEKLTLRAKDVTLMSGEVVILK